MSRRPSRTVAALLSAVDDLAVDHEVDRLERRDAQRVPAEGGGAGRRQAHLVVTQPETVDGLADRQRRRPHRALGAVHLDGRAHDRAARRSGPTARSAGPARVRPGRAHRPRCRRSRACPRPCGRRPRPPRPCRRRRPSPSCAGPRTRSSPLPRPPGRRPGPPRARLVDHGRGDCASLAPGPASRGGSSRQGSQRCVRAGRRSDRNRSVTHAVTRGPPCGTDITRPSGDRPGHTASPRAVDRLGRGRERGADVRQRASRDLGDRADRARQQVGGVGAAAERVHGQVGRVRLDEQEAGRDLAQRVPQGVVRAERDRARRTRGTSRGRPRGAPARRRRRSSGTPCGPGRRRRAAPRPPRRGRRGRGSAARGPAPWPARCACGTPRAGPRGPAVPRGSGPGRSRRWRGCGGWRGRSARPGDRVRQRRLVRAARDRGRPGPARRSPAWRTASFGWMATAPSSCSWVAHRLVGPGDRVEVAPHLDHPRHADGRPRGRSGARRRRHASGAQPSASPRHHRVEVRVVVDDRDRQRLRRRGPAASPFVRAITPGAAARAPPRRSSRRAW